MGTSDCEACLIMVFQCVMSGTCREMVLAAWLQAVCLQQVVVHTKRMDAYSFSFSYLSLQNIDAIAHIESALGAHEPHFLGKMLQIEVAMNVGQPA
jgi:hypothetical protein